MIFHMKNNNDKIASGLKNFQNRGNLQILSSHILN